MKATTMTAMTLMTMYLGTAAYCQPATAAADRTVTVCLSTGTLSGLTVSSAKVLASKMFGEIGVSLRWEQQGRHCPSEAIRITLASNTPAGLKPGALAYALPYEGVHIQVFYDRIENLCEGSILAPMLAHVLVHEITHILEGIKRHSEQGVMKAHWDRADYAQMANGHLQFAPADVQLIDIGLAARQHTAMLAMNTDRDHAIAAQ